MRPDLSDSAPCDEAAPSVVEVDEDGEPVVEVEEFVDCCCRGGFEVTGDPPLDGWAV